MSANFNIFQKHNGKYMNKIDDEKINTVKKRQVMLNGGGLDDEAEIEHKSKIDKAEEDLENSNESLEEASYEDVVITDTGEDSAKKEDEKLAKLFGDVAKETTEAPKLSEDELRAKYEVKMREVSPDGVPPVMRLSIIPVIPANKKRLRAKEAEAQTEDTTRSPDEIKAQDKQVADEFKTAFGEFKDLVSIAKSRTEIQLFSAIFDEVVTSAKNYLSEMARTPLYKMSLASSIAEATADMKEILENGYKRLEDKDKETRNKLETLFKIAEMPNGSVKPKIEACDQIELVLKKDGGYLENKVRLKDGVYVKEKFYYESKKASIKEFLAAALSPPEAAKQRSASEPPKPKREPPLPPPSAAMFKAVYPSAAMPKLINTAKYGDVMKQTAKFQTKLDKYDKKVGKVIQDGELSKRGRKKLIKLLGKAAKIYIKLEVLKVSRYTKVTPGERNEIQKSISDLQSRIFGIVENIIGKTGLAISGQDAQQILHLAEKEQRENSKSNTRTVSDFVFAAASVAVIAAVLHVALPAVALAAGVAGIGYGGLGKLLKQVRKGEAGEAKNDLQAIKQDVKHDVPVLAASRKLDNVGMFAKDSKKSKEQEAPREQQEEKIKESKPHSLRS